MDLWAFQSLNSTFAWAQLKPLGRQREKAHLEGAHPLKIMQHRTEALQCVPCPGPSKAQ